jgi:hypothetical protein
MDCHLERIAAKRLFHFLIPVRWPGFQLLGHGSSLWLIQKY